MNNDTASEQPVALPGSCCLIKSVSYPLSLAQGRMSWLPGSGHEVRIWPFWGFSFIKGGWFAARWQSNGQGTL